MFKKIITLFLLVPTMALATVFVEGKDYKIILAPQVETNKSTTPMIQEFFSYGCPWCYKIETPLHTWLTTMDKKVVFERVPVVFKPSWELYAKAYYTANALALTDKVTPILFKSVLKDKKPLDSKQAMINFFVAQGVDREIAKSAFENSPTIDMRVQSGMALMATYEVSAVPAFVINNKYKTDLQMAGNPTRLLELVDYLTKKSM